MIYFVAILSPTFSAQWYAEIWWWTKFVFTSEDLDPLPLSLLEVKHSKIDVHEFWVKNDSEAVNKFLHHAWNPEYDDSVIILRNVWANDSDTIMQELNSIDAIRKYTEEREYESVVSHPDGAPRGFETRNLSFVLDNLESGDISEMRGLIFDFSFLDTQATIRDAYMSMWAKLDIRLHNRIKFFSRSSHTFLYNTNRWRTELHAAPADDYFLQVANQKNWGFINKKYTPYIGMVKQNTFGVSQIMGTPQYFASDYPDHELPRTYVSVGPGDLMWFPSWHFHEVLNEYDDFGLAFGQRTFRNIGTTEQFGPFWLYNIRGLAALFSKWFIVKVLPDYTWALIAKHVMADRFCKDRYGNPFAMGWNGTHMLRHDYRVVDGECQRVPRQDGYQQKEILKEWNIREWKPKF